MTTADILRKAAARLRAQGWQRKNIGAKHAASCLTGAMLWEIDELTNPNLRSALIESTQRAVRAVLIARGEVVTPRTERTVIMNWNDRQESVDVILEVLEQAAQLPMSQLDIVHS